MKRSERIIEAMGGVDDRFVSEVMTLKSPSRTERVLRVTAVAACLCLCVALSAVFVPKLIGGEITDIDIDYYKGENLPQNTGAFDLNFDGNSVNSSETVIGEAVVSVIQDDRYHTYVSGVVVDPQLVGEKLCEVFVRSCWRNYVLGEDRDVASLRAEIYKIRGVDEAAAVCVKYLDEVEWLTTTHYYSYTNPSLAVNDLRELFSKLGSAEYIDIKDGAVIRFKTRGENDSTVVSRSTLNVTSPIEDALLSLEGEVRSVGEDFNRVVLDGCNMQVYIPVSLTCTGGSAVLFDNGYLLINLGGSNYLFEIGESSAVALIKLIEDSSTPCEEGISEETTRGVTE